MVCRLWTMLCLASRRLSPCMHSSISSRALAVAEVSAVSLNLGLERNLGSHRERVEVGAGIAEVGRAYLLGDVTMQIIEHETDVTIDVPVQSYRVDELLAGENLAIVAEALVGVAKTRERSELAVGAETGRLQAVKARAILLRVVLAHAEDTHAVEEALRPVGVSPFEIVRAVAHLREETLIGAEVIAEVFEFGVEVQLRIRVRPPEIGAERGEVAAVPFRGKVGTIRSAALAGENLAGECVGVVRLPLKVGAEHAVVAAAFVLAVGDQQTGERLAGEVMTPAGDGIGGAEVLKRETRAGR